MKESRWATQPHSSFLNKHENEICWFFQQAFQFDRRDLSIIWNLMSRNLVPTSNTIRNTRCITRKMILHIADLVLCIKSIKLFDFKICKDETGCHQDIFSTNLYFHHISGSDYFFQKLETCPCCVPQNSMDRVWSLQPSRI